MGTEITCIQPQVFLDKPRDLRKALKIESSKDQVKISPLRYQGFVEIPVPNASRARGYVAIQDQKVSEICSIDSSNQ
jgi:hypothetical protein